MVGIDLVFDLWVEFLARSYNGGDDGHACDKVRGSHFGLLDEYVLKILTKNETEADDNDSSCLYNCECHRSELILT